METINTKSTSAHSADCSPIVLRQSEQVRLVFIPTLVENSTNPRASVRGAFVYQRTGKNDEWASVNSESLRTVKKGESFKLELHASELEALGDGVRGLYELVKDQGLPQGRKTFVKVEQGLAKFLELGEIDFKAMLDTQPEQTFEMLLKILQWVARSKNTSDVSKRFASLSVSDLPNITSLLSLTAMKAAFAEWESNQENDSEEFWQSLLAKHASVLSMIFSYPIVMIAEKAYVGGKTIDNKGGKLVDFLLSSPVTGGLVLIEIKTPTTKIFGGKYRDGVYPLSQKLNGAIAQVAIYRQNLMQNAMALSRDADAQLGIGEPRSIVISGTAATELDSNDKKNNFELLREKTTGVTVVTFDELFLLVKQVIGLIEESL